MHNIIIIFLIKATLRSVVRKKGCLTGAATSLCLENDNPRNK